MPNIFTKAETHIKLLKLNENKTNIMEIKTETNLITLINNVEIEKVKYMKYLGFIIGKNLKFEEHIEYSVKRQERNQDFPKEYEVKYL